MDHSKVHSFFSHVSRIAIVLPLVILAVGIVLKTDQQKSFSKTKTLQKGVPTRVQTPTPMQSAKKKGTPINLTGPLVCLVTSKKVNEAKATIFIKDHSVYVQFIKNIPEVQENFYLVKGDCLYRWQKGLPTGEKTCGLQQYMSLMDMMSGINLLDAETMINMFVQQGGDPGLADKFESPVCQKSEIQSNIFMVPSGVKFTEKALISPSKAATP